MFDLLEKVAKATVGVITLPVDVVADVVTMGGELNDRGTSYTGDKLESIVDNLQDSAK
jgi:hypothetical protein